MLTNAPKGTKDIMMDQVYKWHYVEKKWKEICARYGFKEIRTPIFEHTELFQRGVGDTTDIVQKEMYTFEDHGGRSITLKPEGTSPAKAVKLPIVGMAMLVASNSDKHRWNLRFFTKYTSFWCPFSCGRRTECALPSFV